MNSRAGSRFAPTAMIAATAGSIRHTAEPSLLPLSTFRAPVGSDTTAAPITAAVNTGCPPWRSLPLTAASMKFETHGAKSLYPWPRLDKLDVAAADVLKRKLQVGDVVAVIMDALDFELPERA